VRLTTHSDYAFRVLIYLASNPNNFATIKDVATTYRISQNHLMKVVHQLGLRGFVETVRGKGGGIRLARPATAINVGDVLRATEDNFELVECMESGAPECRIARVCVLRRAFNEGLRAFLDVLDEYTLADLVRPRVQLARALQTVP